MSTGTLRAVAEGYTEAPCAIERDDDGRASAVALAGSLDVTGPTGSSVARTLGEAVRSTTGSTRA